MIKPTVYLLMFEYKSRICWCKLEYDEWQIIKHRSEEYLIFDVNGTNARVFVATRDNNLTKQDGIKTASNFVHGSYWNVGVNLDRGEEHRTIGQPLIHPPH